MKVWICGAATKLTVVIIILLFNHLSETFVFMQGVGNYIQWTGDPYDANINIQAVYEAENVQFSDLGLHSGANLTLNENLKRYHGPVWVVATLSDKFNENHR